MFSYSNKYFHKKTLNDLFSDIHQHSVQIAPQYHREELI